MLVLNVAPVQHWHELDIADHMPSSQCAMALMTKVETLSQADQVGEPWQMLFLNLIYRITNNLLVFNFYYR